MNNKCPSCMTECMERKCAFYDVINRRCPCGAEAVREKEKLLKSIEAKLDSILTIGRNRW